MTNEIHSGHDTFSRSCNPLDLDQSLFSNVSHLSLILFNGCAWVLVS